MSTPVINAIENVNQTSLNNLFTAIAQNQTARDNLSRSDRNIDKVSTNVGVIEALNNNEDAIRKMLCRREGKDPSNFSTLDSVAADQNLMQSISARQTSSKILANSQKAITASLASQTARQEIISSQTAMQEVAASQTAMQEIISSQTVIQEVAASQTAMQEVAASQTAMQEVAASQTARQEIISSQTAMQEVAASQTAMQEVAASQTVMQEVAASQTAMQEVATSQTAMQEVAASQTAINEIGSNTNENITENTVLNSSTATTELQNSSLKQSFSASFEFAFQNAGGTNITNSRVLVTSNNNNGDAGTGISFTNDVGPETESGSTFIINEANIIASENSNNAGNISFSGVEIN
jgi:hypothetical protein